MPEHAGPSDLAAWMSRERGIGRPDAEAALDALGDAVSAMLRQGREARIPGLARFLVRRVSREELGKPAVEREVVSQVSVLLREKVLGKAAPSLIALIDPAEESAVVEMLKNLESQGACVANPVSSPSEAVASLSYGGPAVILVGWRLAVQDYQALARNVRLNATTCNTPIVWLVPEDTDPFSTGVTIIPDELVDVPVDLERVGEVLKSELARAATASDEYLGQLAVRFPSSGDEREQALEMLERLAELTPMSALKLAELTPAIREGLCRVLGDEGPGSPKRYADISCLADAEKLVVILRGAGLPGETGEEKPAEDDLGFSSMIMKKGADETEFLPGGRIMITKYY